MESHYIINVAGKTGHFFKTGPITYKERAEEVFEELTVRFPEHSITLTYWSIKGTSVLSYTR